MLTLTVNARNCTYKFMLQAEVFGNGRRWRSGEAAKRYTGYRWINSVRGEGAITSPRSISGSGPAEVLSYDQIGDSQFKKPPLWVNEMDPVPSLMRGSDLGTVFVTWHFEPVE